MKLFAALLPLFFFSSSALAAPLSWEWLAPRPTAEKLLDVAVGLTDEKKELVIAVGARGILLSSDDQGETWSVRDTGVKSTLFDVAFIDQGKGYFVPMVVGENGTILRGSYDGKTWKKLDSGTKATLRSIWGFDSTRIYAAGDKGTLLVSEDGGGSWKALKPGVKTTLSSIVTPSASEVYIAGTGNVLLYSKDGKKFSKKKNGIVWKDKEIPEESPRLSLTPEGSLWITGANGALLFSSDQGKLWSSPPISSSPKSGCARYLVSSKAELICSSDGTSWGVQEIGKGFLPRAVAWLDPKRVYAVGDGGLLLRSLDQGKTWENRSKGEPGALHAFWALGNNDLFAVGKNGRILRSTDGGKNWTVSTSGTTQHLTAIWGDAEKLVAVGEQGVILRSTDKGNSWTLIKSETKEKLEGVWGSGADLYAVGANSTVLVSFTAGETWQAILGDARTEFKDVWGTGPNNIFITGISVNSARILQSANGTNWTSTTFGNTNTIDALGGDGTNIFAVSPKLLLRSTDNGKTWTPQITTLTGSASEVSQSNTIVGVYGDAKEIFIVSQNGSLFRSTNQGKSWSFEALPFGFVAKDVFGIGDQLFIAGSAGSFEAVIHATR